MSYLNLNAVLLQLIVLIHMLVSCRGLTYVPDAFEEDEFLTDDVAKRKFLSCECGGQNDSLDGFREFVVIKMMSEDRSEVPKYCGGSVINDLLILTTMSCVIEKKELNVVDHVLRRKEIDHSKITVYSRVTPNYPLSRGVILKVHSIVCHPYAFPSMILTDAVDYDVCLIRLESRLQLEGSDAMQTVCLFSSVSKSGDIVDSKAVGINFVQKQGESNQSDFIAEFSKEPGIIFSRENCETKSERMICYRNENSGSFGPYGSPVMGLLKYGLVVQVGVASYKSVRMDRVKFQYCSIYQVVTNLDSKDVQHFINTQSERVKARWCKYRRSNVGLKKVEKAEMTRALQPYTTNYCWDRPSANPPVREISKSCRCGLTRSTAKSRIVGGTEVSPNKYEWQAQLLITQKVAPNKEQTQGCGGTVINSKFILTAAHCVAGLNCQYVANPSDIIVKLKRHAGFLHKTDKEGVTVKVIKVFCHPEFSQEKVEIDGQTYNSLRSDIALLELEDHIDFDDVKDIRPICLGEKNMLVGLIGKSAVVVGWGHTKQNSPDSLSSTLHELEVTVVENQVCRTALEGLGFQFPDKVICAGNFKSFEEYKDPFHGDSGGPLMLQASFSDAGEDKLYFAQMGIVSGGSLSVTHSPKPTDVPVVWYTSVAGYLPFIEYLSYQGEAVWCTRP